MLNTDRFLLNRKMRLTLEAVAPDVARYVADQSYEADENNIWTVFAVNPDESVPHTIGSASVWKQTGIATLQINQPLGLELTEDQLDAWQIADLVTQAFRTWRSGDFKLESYKIGQQRVSDDKCLRLNLLIYWRSKRAIDDIGNTIPEEPEAPKPLPQPKPTPMPRPTISHTGSGYAGSLYSVTDGGDGVWQLDYSDGAESGWQSIPDATQHTYMRTVQGEGLPIRWMRADQMASRPIHMWMPTDLDPIYRTLEGSRWIDFKRTDLLTLTDTGTAIRIASAPDQFHPGERFSQSNASRQPYYDTSTGFGAAKWGTNTNWELAPTAEFGPRFMMFVTTYNNGVIGTFYNSQGMASCGTNSNVSSRRIMGEIRRSNMASNSWCSQWRKNGHNPSQNVLPLNQDILSGEGPAEVGHWALGRGYSGNTDRSWQGLIMEFIALDYVPEEDDYARLIACVAHRNGTIAKLEASNPENPYINEGPRV